MEPAKSSTSPHRITQQRRRHAEPLQGLAREDGAAASRELGISRSSGDGGSASAGDDKGLGCPSPGGEEVGPAGSGISGQLLNNKI